MGLTHLIDIIYPLICPVCRNKIIRKNNEKDEFVCSACWDKIAKNTPPFCYRCGRSLKKKKTAGNICLRCVKQTLYFDRAFSPCLYEGVIKDLIRAFKYENKDYLGKPLSVPMIEFVKEYNLPIGAVDSIIPIPLSAAKLREREFNQAAVLAEYLGREFDKNVCADKLFRSKNTRTQTGLKDETRFSNVKDAFSVAGQTGLNGSNILLIDDVLTTGATCSEASLTLKNAGANIVYVLTLAN